MLALRLSRAGKRVVRRVRPDVLKVDLVAADAAGNIVAARRR